MEGITSCLYSNGNDWVDYVGRREENFWSVLE